MEKTAKQRLMEFITYKGISQGKFERLCEMSNGYLNNLKKTLGAEKLQNVIRAFPELNTEWLLYGEGEMIKKTSTTINGDITITGDNNSHIGHGNTYSNFPAIIEIKENAVDVECPNCGEIIEVPSDAILPLIPEEIAKQPDVDIEAWRHNNPHEMQEVDLRQIWGGGIFVMRVDTRAMEPEYREGTFLVLRKLPDLSYARTDGSPYVIDTMRPHTLFRYLSKERDGTYVLSAENDKRGPLYLSAEDIQNIYDIVGSFRIGR